MKHVGDLEADAIVEHQVSTNHYVHIVRWGRRKHHLQLPRTGLHPPAQSRRKRSVHDQLPLKSRRKVIALCESGRQVVVMRPVPSANVAVMIHIMLVPLMMMTVAMVMIVVAIIAFVPAIVIIMLVVTAPIALGHCKGCR